MIEWCEFGLIQSLRRRKNIEKRRKRRGKSGGDVNGGGQR
jgi:hypothetical protein